MRWRYIWVEYCRLCLYRTSRMPPWSPWLLQDWQMKWPTRSHQIFQYQSSFKWIKLTVIFPYIILNYQLSYIFFYLWNAQWRYQSAESIASKIKIVEQSNKVSRLFRQMGSGWLRWKGHIPLSILRWKLMRSRELSKE